MTHFARPGQNLVDHLLSVAQRCRILATSFDAIQQGLLAGLLHDLGKADAEFQKRISHANKESKEDGEKRPHAHHGAALALDHQLWPVAFAVNGHHTGLHDRSALQQVKDRWLTKAKSCESALASDSSWPEQTWPVTDFGETLPAWLTNLPFNTPLDSAAKMRAVEFYTRMLFSALVDADRLDSESATAGSGSESNARKRQSWRFGLDGLAALNATDQLLETLNAAIVARAASAQQKGASQIVLSTRAAVLAACQSSATKARGVFSLTVPTGGGKTLASVAFALEHIRYHNASLANGARPLRRIIIVIPYLNIIQQTTKELMAVFGHSEANPLILEHHSQASDPEPKDAKKDADGWDQKRSLRQLAAENWDAPIIVTTSVQFFDSLFSRRPADARKLHNICQSVVIFDEVQSLPPLLLQPILDVLQELAGPQRPYGCSLVLCTATQPALGKGEGMEFGFAHLTPIIPPDQANEHFRRLKRVTYHGLGKDTSPPSLTNDQLATAMLAAPRQQALTILNTRRQARALFDVLKAKSKSGDCTSDAVFHLSTWMYPAHRLLVLEHVTSRLNHGLPCLLVSTQCVEAGVDVDFPSVWRAFGPYDSIVQAAGRCNRHGILENGNVYVFTPEDGATPGGTYGSAIDTARLLNRLGLADPDSPESFEMYFRLFYQVTTPDLGGCAIQSEREQLHFEKVSDAFSFIDADNVPLLIGAQPENESPHSTLTLPDGKVLGRPKGFFTPDEWRSLQPYTVNLSFPQGAKTRLFLDKNAQLVFADDDKTRGLYRLTDSRLYDDGPNGAGLDTTAASLSIIDAL